MKHSTLMDTDDLEPIIKPKEIDFDTLSIEELKEYIIELNAEIKRAENYIDRNLAVLNNLDEAKYSESEIKELGLSIGTGCREDNSFQLAAN